MDDLILNIGSGVKRKAGAHVSQSPLLRTRPTDGMPKYPSKIKRKVTKSADAGSTFKGLQQSKSSSSHKATVISNPLQFRSNKHKKLSSTNVNPEASTNEYPDLETLMNVPARSHIEPLFSQTKWKDFAGRSNLYPHLLSCLTERFNLVHLTAIQEISISQILNGNDCLIRAQTGSGKTLAYAVPLLNHLINIQPPLTRADGPVALVLLPTRELATQTFEVFRTLAHACVRIVPGCLIGGTNRKPQKVSLRKGINIVIGTPQRVLDHMLRTSSLRFEKLRFLVVDEADRLLELGFEKSVFQIVNRVHSTIAQAMPSKLQTILLSATLTPGVEKLAGLALKNAVRCTVQETQPEREVVGTATSPTEHFAMPAGLRHFVLVVPWKLRLISLAAFLLLKCRYRKRGGKLIVFMATQDCVDFHYNLFKTVLCPHEVESVVPAKMSKLSVFRLHGSMEHSEREKVFHEFSTSIAGILITTDVASRGLDLASVVWVVQYHVTGGPVDYVHRVGRTARAGGQGKALIFLDEQELGFTHLLRTCAGIKFDAISLPDLMQTALFHVQNVKQTGRRSGTCTTVEEGVSRFFHLMLDAVAESDTLQLLAESAYISFLRSYASFSKELRQYFVFKRLHLGHVARAFCLQSTPKDVASRVTGRRHAASKVPKKRRSSFADEEIPLKRPSLSVTRSNNRTATAGKLKSTEKAKQNMLAEFGL